MHSNPNPGEIIMIIAISLAGSSILLGMLLLTIRSIVRTSLLSSLKAKCVAAGMSAAEIERVVLVGDRGKFARKSAEASAEYDYLVEKKAPPILADRGFAAAR